MTAVLDTSPLEARKQQLRAAAEQILYSAQAQGRQRLNAGEQARYDLMLSELSGLTEDIERRSAINQNVGNLSSRLQGGAYVTTDDRNLTYRRGDRRTSWVRDLCLSQSGYDSTGECRRRLDTHGREVAEHPAYTEYRDLSRTDGQGGFAVPPAWLMDQYIELARPGRPFADLIQSRPLPGGTDSINIPKVLTGTAVGVQVADNTTIVDVDLTDTYISAPVRTIAGAQSVALQLIDQSPISFDDVVFSDLVSAHAAVTDVQLLAGTGASGQVLGISNTPGISTVTVASQDIQGFYRAVANAIQLVHTTRFLAPTALVVHPRRWGWLLSLLDTTNRPLVIPSANGPMNVAGLQQGVVSQGAVGQMAGVQVYVDPNIPTNSGYGANQDFAYLVRAEDIVLWESGIRARVLPEPKSSTLTVVLQVYSYIAASAGRYPQSIVQLVGMTPPAF